MDGQMRLTALVVGLLFLVGTATLVVSSNLFNYTPFQTPPEYALSSQTGGQRTLSQQEYRQSRRQTSDTDISLLSARSQVSRLEKQLEYRSKQLDDRNGRIDQLNEQLREFRETRSSASGPRLQTRTIARTESPPEATVEPEFREEIARLNQSLLAADLQDAEYQQEIASLRNSLDRANDELDLLEDGADAQLKTVALQQQRRQRIIGDLVARFGSDSIPLLVDFLEEDDPQLRIWALQVLGQLGDDGEEALEDINPLFEDPSADVRNAARQAVDSIRGR